MSTSVDKEMATPTMVASKEGSRSQSSELPALTGSPEITGDEKPSFKADDEEKVTSDAANGVKKMEAVTLVWTKPWLITAMFL